MTPSLICSNQAKAEPPSRDALILIYLNHVDGLLRKYAASTRMDYEDLRQDACIVIMHCLSRKPDQQEILHGYVTVSVRNRIISSAQETPVIHAGEEWAFLSLEWIGRGIPYP